MYLSEIDKAVECGDIEDVKRLYQLGCPWTKHPIEIAAAKNDEKMIDFLLRNTHCKVTPNISFIAACNKSNNVIVYLKRHKLFDEKEAVNGGYQEFDSKTDILNLAILRQANTVENAHRFNLT